MRNFQFFQPVNVALYLLLGLSGNAFTLPLINRYYTELQNLPNGYELGFVGDRPYARFDPTSFVYQIDDPNANYLYPSYTSMLSDAKLDINAQKENVEPSTSDQEFRAGLYMSLLQKLQENIESEERLHNSYNDNRSGGEDNIDPKFLNGVRSTLAEMVQKKLSADGRLDQNAWEDNAFDHVSGRSNDEPDIDPRFISGVRATMLDLMNQRSDRVQTNSTTTNNSTKPVKPLPSDVVPKPYSAGYVFHPGPVPLMQTIQQAHFAEPTMFYDGSANNYPMPASTSIFAIPAASPPISAPFPTAYNFPGQDSYYLQPTYGAAPFSLSPNVFQVWPLASQDEYKPLAASYDSRIWNASLLNEEFQKPSENAMETNLTKIDIDPIYIQKEVNARLPSPGGTTSAVRGTSGGKNKKVGSSSSHRPIKNAVSGRSFPEYEQEERRPANRKPIPLVKKILMPVSPSGGKRAAPLSGLAHKDQVRPRYKVMYHLQKTYVPILS